MNKEDLIVLHEDNHIIVVLKPQNVPCCEDDSKDYDLLTAIKDYIKEKENKPGNVYVGLVHRLDRVTGGVMVFAKSSKSASRLAEQMKSGDFSKTYLTVTVGEIKRKKAVLVNYLRKNAVTNTVYVCTETEKDAKKAELDYEVEETVNGLNLVNVNLHTGRSHQIRVQFASIGSCVFGDRRYGGENARKGNIALWATKLCFTHPVTKERMVFKIEPPTGDTPWNIFDVKKVFEKL